MSSEYFRLKKALAIYGTTLEEIKARGIRENMLPPFARSPSENRILRSWTVTELPAVGERIGFLQKPKHAIVVAVFVTKGGVLKSSLTLNLARVAALHNIRTCVVGLDMQGDVSTALAGPDDALDEGISFDDAIMKMNSLRGLTDVFADDMKLDDVLRRSDLPTLAYIPETPELMSLDQSLMNRNRREYWLKENVIESLKEKFELIIMDCSPNWNRLITNALVACDILISPLECRINNFRNLKTFRALLEEFKEDVRVDFQQIFVPTRLTAGRRLSQEIFKWYQKNLPECTRVAIRESVQGEEAIALRVSVPEYAPTSVAADEIRQLMSEIWTSIRREPTKSTSLQKRLDSSRRIAEFSV